MPKVLSSILTDVEDPTSLVMNYDDGGPPLVGLFCLIVTSLAHI